MSCRLCDGTGRYYEGGYGTRRCDCQEGIEQEKRENVLRVEAERRYSRSPCGVSLKELLELLKNFEK